MNKIDKPEGLPLKDRIRNVSAEVVRDFKIRGIHPLENNKIYNFLGGMTRTEKRAILERHTKPEHVTIVEKSLGEEFSICLFHPGIKTRLKTFIDFCMEQKEKDEHITPIEALSRFSSHLGETTLYRGMALTTDEAEIIQQQGIVAPVLRDEQHAIRALAVLLDPDTKKFDMDSPYPTNFSHDVMFRSTNLGGSLNDSDRSISISTSGYNEVANSVSWHTSERTNIPEVSPYLYTLRIPTLLTYNEKEITGDIRGLNSIIVGDKTFDSEELEIFVPFGIPSKMISNVELTPIPPTWKKINIP